MLELNLLSTLPSNAFAGLSQVTDLCVIFVTHVRALADPLIEQATLRQPLDHTASHSIRWFESATNAVRCTGGMAQSLHKDTTV